jgi:PqqD family protein of HPr-rel-A system
VAGTVWRLQPLRDLHWRRWDDEFVVFDLGSGETHLFDALTAAALMCFDSGPLDLDGLTAQIAAELALPRDEGLSPALSELIEGLSRLGLVEPNTP